MIIIQVFMSIFFILILSLLVLKWVQLTIGRKKTYQKIKESSYEIITDLGSVKNLTVLPLVDFYTDNKRLKTEAGVSYLVKTDENTILMDTGFNQKKEHPSPLLQNMETLGISVDEIDAIFISHCHLDHVGGMQEQKNQEFSLSKGIVNLPEIKVYSPVPISPSPWNLGPTTEVVQHPKKLKQGIASIGIIPRYLFLMGETEEHSLAINVENKGIVLIIGCGHQTIERIIERAQMIFKEPIYAIIGGLHFPVKKGRLMLGSINLQNIFGSDHMPWRGIKETDVQSAIKSIQKIKPQFIALSPHDSSDWSITEFKTAFKEKYHDIKVGEILVI